jgi:hypothetical protein
VLVDATAAIKESTTAIRDMKGETQPAFAKGDVVDVTDPLAIAFAEERNKPTKGWIVQKVVDGIVTMRHPSAGSFSRATWSLRADQVRRSEQESATEEVVSERRSPDTMRLGMAASNTSLALALSGGRGGARLTGAIQPAWHHECSFERTLARVPTILRYRRAVVASSADRSERLNASGSSIQIE